MHTKRLTTVITLALFAIGIIAGFVFWHKNANDEAGVTQARPKFVFDNAAFPGWWTVGNAHPQDTAGNKAGNMPISSISIHQCKEDAECSEETALGNCFVGADYFKGTIDPEQAIAEKIKQIESLDDTTIREIDIKPHAMHTIEGDKNYQLHQYDYETGTYTILRGSAFGYIPLNNGYIEVRSICTDANQLDATLPVLSAIRLEN